MNILLIHQNYPGQFKHLGPALAQLGHRVVAMTMKVTEPGLRDGVQIVPYRPSRGTTNGIHPWVGDFETKVIRGEACLHAAMKLNDEGFEPDAIVAHHGWGESLLLKELWPKSSMGIYCEFYYHAQGADVGFDSEFPLPDLAERCRLRLRNLNNMVHFEIASRGISPTHWQASTFPEHFRGKIDAIHDGIDTNTLVPNPHIAMKLAEDIHIHKGDEVITFVNRNLEPYRGYHTFMRALPKILGERPNARVLIVGGDDVSYGARPQNGQSWREIYWNEALPKMTEQMRSRVHFLGHVSYEQFVAVLQISSVHVYLTYPFVLSWSLLEAMSVGCAIVASDTQPLKEVIVHNETGLMVSFFEPEKLAKEVCCLLADSALRDRLGRNAREFARKTYDLQSVCLPRQIEWVNSLANR